MDTAEKMLQDTLATMSGASYAELCDYLSYRNYRHSRESRSAEELAREYPGAAEFELRYRDEINDYVEAAIRYDQERRYSGTAAGDLDTFGRRLQEGA